MLSIIASWTPLNTSGGICRPPGVWVPSLTPVAAGEIGRYGRPRAVPQPLRDLDRAVTRHDRVSAEDVVRATLFGPSGHQQHGRLAVLDLLGDLGVGGELELHDVFHVHRPRRLRERGRGDERRRGGKHQGLLHTTSHNNNAHTTYM